MHGPLGPPPSSLSQAALFFQFSKCSGKARGWAVQLEGGGGGGGGGEGGGEPDIQTAYSD